MFFALCCFATAESETQVLFLELRNGQGEVLLLEPDFPYAHVAVQLRDGKIIHSHPRGGVQEVTYKQLGNFGTVKESVVIERETSEISNEEFEKLLGKPYDFGFSWDNDRFYCSELVAKILGISPEPMHFDQALWPPSFWELEGKPGISPGKIYRKLKSQAFLFEKTS